MNVYLPFTHLRCETYEACLGAKLIPLRDHEKSYGYYWHDIWEKGETFINVEQDVVPLAGVLEEMWNCPHPYCRTEYSYPWAGSRIDTSPIGCAKFSSEFIAQYPKIFLRGIVWHEPQHVILNASLNKGHVHNPPSLHLHVADDWPLEALRRFKTP